MDAPLHRCALCGHQYDLAAEGCRPSCPLGGCGLVCCPRCGHAAPKDGPVSGALRRLLVRLGGGRKSA